MIRIREAGDWPNLTEDSYYDLFVENATIDGYAPASYRDDERSVCVRNGRMHRRDEWSDQVVEYGDELTFVRFPQAGAIAAIGQFLFQVAVTALVSYAISEGIQALMGSSELDDPFENAPDPTYTFTGVRNTAQSGIPIPVVYGTHVVGGNFLDVNILGNNPYVSGENYGNSLALSVALSEGPIDEVISTRINGNDLATYGNTVVQTSTLGTNDQAALPGNDQSTSVFPVALELLEPTTGNPYDPSSWVQGEARSYTTTQVVDAVRVVILFPEGLVHVDENDGFHHPDGMTFSTRYRVNDPQGAWSPWVDYSVVSNVSTPFTQVRVIEFPTPDVYDIEVARKQPKPDTIYFKDRTDLDSVVEVIYDASRYPNVALTRLVIEADRSVSGGLPTVTSLIRGRTILRWDGVDEDNPNFIPDAPDYSNPAWVAYDLLTNQRYGLGRWVEAQGYEIDLPSFLDWSDWCDELVPDGRGALEKRCQFDAQFSSSSTSAWDVLLQIASSARATFVVVGDLIKVKVEKPRTPTQLFSMGNIREGSFRQSWVSAADRPTRTEVVFLNRDLEYQRDSDGIDDPDALDLNLPVRIREVQLFGITRQSQALREARFRMNLSKLTRVVEWEADIDAVTCEVGDLVQVAHDVPAWGKSGRILQQGSFGSEFILDQDVTLEDGQTYEVVIRHVSDVLDVREVSSPAGEYPAGTSLFAVSSFSTIPEPGAVYSIGRRNLSVQTVKVVDITTNPDLTRSLQGVVYTDAIHEDSIGTLDTPVVSELPDPSAVPACVTNLAAASVTSTSGGSTTYSVQVSWTYPQNQNLGGATIWYRDLTGGNPSGGVSASAPTTYTQIGDVSFPQSAFTMTQGLSPGSTYDFTVLAYSQDGASRTPGQCSSSTVEIAASSGVVPAEPQNVTVSYVGGDDLVISWDPVLNVSVASYEVRRGLSWVGSIEVGQTTSTTLTTPRWAPTSGSSIEENFFVRAVSYSGDYGYTATIGTGSGGLPVWQNGTSTQTNEAGSSWPGSLTNLTNNGGVLELTLPDLPGVYLSSTIDTGAPGAYRLGAVTHMTQDSGWTWTTAGGAWNSSPGRLQGWLGYADPDLWRNNFRVEFQGSADNNAYSDWFPLVTQTVSALPIGLGTSTSLRYFRLRVTLTPSDPDFPPRLEQLYITTEAR